MTATVGTGIEIVNLKAFRADLRRSIDATPRELSRAIKAAGAPIVESARGYAPIGHRRDDKHPGALSRSYTVRASGTTGRVYSRVPYGIGAEWGLHGKWSGFTRYPGFGTGASAGRGRFAWRAVVERQDEIVEIITRGMREIIELHGWASPE